MRKEYDPLGEMMLPDNVYYGIETERNRRALAANEDTLDRYPAYVKAVAQVKKACAMANKEIGAFDAAKADAVMKACDEMMEGKFAGNFPICIYRGSGTPFNMAANEVLAHRANEILSGDRNSGEVHPNTHVNMCQSSNDVIPTAKGFVVYEELGKAVKAAEFLAESLARKAEEFKDVIKLGRTCLQDAVPMTLGQEFAAYATGIRRMAGRLRRERENWNTDIMGATAIGTGIGCMPGFRALVHKKLSEVLGREIRCAENLIDSQQAMDSVIIAHAHLQALAALVWKIARDVRYMTSGPRAGLADIVIPPVQPGSSIMPGKVNPVIPEMVSLSCDQVSANHAGLAFGAFAGYLELGSSSAVPVKAIMDSSDLLSRTMVIFAERCIDGITANVERCRVQAEHSISLSTMVSALFGYDIGTRIAKRAIEEKITCKEAALRENILPAEAVEDLFDLKNLVDPDKMEALFVKYASYRKV